MESSGVNTVLIITATIVCFGTFLLTVFFAILIKRKCARSGRIRSRRVRTESREVVAGGAINQANNSNMG